MIEASTERPNSDQSSNRFPRCARIISVKHDASFCQTVKQSNSNSASLKSIADVNCQFKTKPNIKEKFNRHHVDIMAHPVRTQPELSLNPIETYHRDGSSRTRSQQQTFTVQSSHRAIKDQGHGSKSKDIPDHVQANKSRNAGRSSTEMFITSCHFGTSGSKTHGGLKLETHWHTQAHMQVREQI